MCHIFWVYICSLAYPACNAHAPYCLLWPVRIYNIFPHFIINSMSFEKKKLLTKMCLDFLYNSVWTIYHSKKNSGRYHERTESFMKRARFMVKFEWSSNFLTDFFKNSKISNFTKIRQVWAELLYADGQVGRRRDRQTLQQLLVSLFPVSRTPLKTKYAFMCN